MAPALRARTVCGKSQKAVDGHTRWGGYGVGCPSEGNTKMRRSQRESRQRTQHEQAVFQEPKAEGRGEGELSVRWLCKGQRVKCARCCGQLLIKIPGLGWGVPGSLLGPARLRPAAKVCHWRASYGGSVLNLSGLGAWRSHISRTVFRAGGR